MKMKTYTAFCQAANGRGTVWIEAIEAIDLVDAKAVAQAQCALAWETDLNDVRVLGIAAGDVDILAWDDVGD